MIGRAFGLLWLTFIFFLGFGSGAVYWSYHQWDQSHPGRGFTAYVSHTLQLSKDQERLLEKAVVSKDEKMERFKKNMEPKLNKAREGAREKFQNFLGRQGETS